MLSLFGCEIRAWIEALIRWTPGLIGNAARRYWFRRRFKSGEHVFIGTGCEFLSPQTMCFEDSVAIGGGSFFSAEGGAIFVGSGTSFNANVHINASVGGTIQIGDSCLIGPNVVMRTAGHRFDNPRIPIRQQGHIALDINIGNDVWIGAGAIVLGGVSIVIGAVIGAGAVVTKDIASMDVAVGIPARMIRSRKNMACHG